MIARLKTALEIHAVFLFAWYLRVSCSRWDLTAPSRSRLKTEKVGFGSGINDETTRG